MYDWQAGGMHPTGMLSCWLLRPDYVIMQRFYGCVIRFSRRIYTTGGWQIDIMWGISNDIDKEFNILAFY